MTDFIIELEAELVGAARRRATRRRPVLPRLVPAFAAVAAVALLVLAASQLARSPGPADEQPVPKLGEGVVVKLPPAVAPVEDRTCADSGWSAYAPTDAQLAVFARARADGDDLPLAADQLPTAFVDGEAARRTALGDTWLVPAFGIGESCNSEADTFDTGACLVVGDAPPLSGCFSDADIAAGRAVMFVSSGHVAGIAPNGVQAAEVNGVIVPVRDNAYEAEVPGVAVGDKVSVHLGPVPTQDCRPSRAVYDAAPELRQPPNGNPPQALGDAMAQLGSTGRWRPYARAADPRGGIEVWVTPDLPCDRPGIDEERVCILPQGGSLLCDTPAAIERRGVSIVYPYNNGRVAAGIAARDTLRVAWENGDVLANVAMASRVFAAPINAGPRTNVRIRYLK